MTIGPDPMMSTELISSRRGIGSLNEIGERLTYECVGRKRRGRSLVRIDEPLVKRCRHLRRSSQQIGANRFGDGEQAGEVFFLFSEDDLTGVVLDEEVVELLILIGDDLDQILQRLILARLDHLEDEIGTRVEV